MNSKWLIDSSWTLFLDRDGVINERIWNGYVLNYSEFKFREKTLDALSQFSNIFNHIFIVTNQQCVGKGLITELDLLQIHDQMILDINLNSGKITEIYSALELKNSEPFRRKPNIKIALEAQSKYPEINFSKSIMIGDTDSDIEFGKKLGMMTIRIISEEKNNVKADLEVSDLLEVMNYLNY
jgi:histidinol-phosphate phosphatase family protein